MISPHTTTASTPEECTTSASRNAVNGMSSSATLPSSGSASRPRTRTPIQATTTPDSAPTATESRNSAVTCGTVKCSAPTVMPTASPYSTSAVPSLTRLSARSVVMVRRGSARARTLTAVASVGATAAPSTHAAPQGSPSRYPTTATAPAVAMTSTVDSSTMGRRLLRISRSEVVRLSQNSSAGRNSSRTVSGGSRTSRSAGTKPSSTPPSSSTMGGATRSRRAVV